MALSEQQLKTRIAATEIQIRQLLDDLNPLEKRLREIRAELARLKTLRGSDQARLNLLNRRAEAQSAGHDPRSLTLPGIDATIEGQQG